MHFNPISSKDRLNTRLLIRAFFNFADLGRVWEPYLKLDVLCLSSICSIHSMEMQTRSGFGIKDCLTEASLGWKSFEKDNKDREFSFFYDTNVRDFNVNQMKEEE